MCVRACAVTGSLQAVLWTNKPNIAGVYRDNSAGRFVIDQSVSQIVQVQLGYNIAEEQECPVAGRWFHEAQGNLTEAGVNVSSYTMRCVALVSDSRSRVVSECDRAWLLLREWRCSRRSLVSRAVCRHCVPVCAVCRVYMYPEDIGLGTCGFVGVSDVGCTASNCNSFLLRSSPALFLHEMGHLVGFAHAQYDADNNGIITVEEAQVGLPPRDTCDACVVCARAVHLRCAHVLSRWLPSFAAVVLCWCLLVLVSPRVVVRLPPSPLLTRVCVFRLLFFPPG